MRKFFNRLFGSKETETADVKLDFTVADLQKGYILSFDHKNWQVEEVSHYYWDNSIIDQEFTLNDGAQLIYLNYSKSGNKESIFWAEELHKVWSEARKKLTSAQIAKNDTFNYEGRDYFFASEGTAMITNSKEKFEMENWLFSDSTNEHLVSFNRYEDGSSEVYVGRYLKKFEVSNILPRA